MEPRIENFEGKMLVGMRRSMSLADNKTGDLWRAFMPRRKEIHRVVGNDFYSMQRYPPLYFEQFSPAAEFVKWAAVEVEDTEDGVPENMETVTIPGGLYAVFLHKGGPEQAAATFQHIFGAWLPNSGYLLDDRPHFEVLGGKYKHNDPSSEEDIWVPIRKK